MKTKKTLLIIGIFLFLGISFSVNAQNDKYGSDPEKCKINMSLFHEAVKMKNYSAALEPWQWCFDNTPRASKMIYSDGLKYLNLNITQPVA